MKIELPDDIFTYPDVAMPLFWRVEQQFSTPSLTTDQIETAVTASVNDLLKSRPISEGSTVAVGVGSRGLDNLKLVVKTVVKELLAQRLKPFIFPAMGSHGGAVAEGQIEVLAGYGITEETVGAPVRATMEVDEVGRLSGSDAGSFEGHPVFCDRIVKVADAILLINRIKPHTDFQGEIESGIGKMCAIGLGKRHGAESIHRHGANGLRELMPRVARFLARSLPILGGIALLENEFGNTAEVHSVHNRDIADIKERQLLAHARSMSPRLPFQEIDVLIIDEIGKNISGACMDTHVLGRSFMPSVAEETWGGPNIRIVAALDLTAESHGNAVALGLSDLTTRELIEKTDFNATYINMRTSGEGGVLRGSLPLVMPTREDCVRTAMATCGRVNLDEVRLVRIRNTMHVHILEVSKALLEDVRSNNSLRLLGEPHTLNLENRLEL